MFAVAAVTLVVLAFFLSWTAALYWLVYESRCGPVGGGLGLLALAVLGVWGGGALLGAVFGAAPPG